MSQCFSSRSSRILILQLDHGKWVAEGSGKPTPKKKKAKVRKAVSADNTLDICVAGVTALSAVGLAFFIFTLGAAN